MTRRQAIDKIAELGDIFREGLAKVGKGELVGDESDLEMGIIAYNTLGLDGENDELDLAYDIVSGMLYRLHFERGTMH